MPIGWLVMAARASQVLVNTVLSSIPRLSARAKSLVHCDALGVSRPRNRGHMTPCGVDSPAENHGELMDTKWANRGGNLSIADSRSRVNPKYSHQYEYLCRFRTMSHQSTVNGR